MVLISAKFTCGLQSPTSTEEKSGIVIVAVANNCSEQSDTKRAKSIVADHLKKSTLIPILQENIAREAYVRTDEARQYQGIGAGKVFDAWLDQPQRWRVRELCRQRN